ncbi:hypothetical protein ACFL3X_00505 [Gemmatimonadota bacterium]
MDNNGTIRCAELLDHGFLPQFIKGAGIYKVRISPKAHRRELHGPSPIIHIGKGSEKWGGLTWRMGEFVAAALGFLGVPHSSGIRFNDVRDKIDLTVRDLLIDWERCAPSRTAQRERAEFDRFSRALNPSDMELLLKVRHKVLCEYDELRFGIGKPYPLLSQRRG